MDPLFEDNIKVHFAGTEQYSIAYIVNHVGVRYSLFSCYGFLGQQVGLNVYPQNPRCDHIFVPAYLEQHYKNVIMDSGIFSLMYGSGKGQKGQRDIQFFDKWYSLLVEYVQQHNLHCTIVDIDCQKILGCKEAWYFREKMKEQLPDNRQINVFHLEDGQKGLDRMIEFSDYIAIGVPEFRIERGKTHKEDVYRLADYIKTKKPNIDIHLLGCTDRTILSRCKFCTSADSTSYLSSLRYGSLFGHNIHKLKRDIFKKYYNDYAGIIKGFEMDVNKKMSENYKKWMIYSCIASEKSLERYNIYCGPQN